MQTNLVLKSFKAGGKSFYPLLSSLRLFLPSFFIRMTEVSPVGTISLVKHSLKNASDDEKIAVRGRAERDREKEKERVSFLSSLLSFLSASTLLSCSVLFCSLLSSSPCFSSLLLADRNRGRRVSTD